MRPPLLPLLTAGAMLLFAPQAFAQNSVSASVPAGSSASLTITVNAQVQSITTLIISGNDIDPMTTFDTVTAGVGATIDFGTVNRNCAVEFGQAGQCHVLTDLSGARIVSTLEIEVLTPGGTFDLGLETSGSAVGTELYKLCGTGSTLCPTEAADADWEDPASTNVVAIPGTGASTGVELATTAASGTLVNTQIGVEFGNADSGTIAMPVLFTTIQN